MGAWANVPFFRHTAHPLAESISDTLTRRRLWKILSSTLAFAPFATIPAKSARLFARRQESRDLVLNEFSDKNHTCYICCYFCGWSGFSGVR
jgi:hypothetical protein